MTFHIPFYLPSFFWNFWLSEREGASCNSRIHMYDIYANELSDITTPPGDSTSSRSIFDDFNDPYLLTCALAALRKAEARFLSFEKRAEEVLKTIMTSHFSSVKSIPIGRDQCNTLVKFFIFLRFRNSAKYRETLYELLNGDGYAMEMRPADGFCVSRLADLYGPLWKQIRCQAVLNAFIKFFDNDSTAYEPCFRMDPLQQVLDSQLWRFCDDAEICLGISEDQEFILPDTGFGILDEAFGEESNSECLDCFFPIHPTLALYIIGGAHPAERHKRIVTLQMDVEQAIDVHLRNAMILSSIPNNHRYNNPHFPSLDQPMSTTSVEQSHNWRYSRGPTLFFRSLSSITRSISSYDEFRCRWIPDQFYDYSRLKHRCRQRYMMETVTKTLVIKGDISVVDLTDEVEFVSKGPLAIGAFSDVWQGKWYDAVERKQRVVAIKFLRQVMVDNVHEKLIKRLHAEVVTWHRLWHRNVSPFFGIMSTTHSIGMVSEWCVNGTIVSYLEEKKTKADRLMLLTQIASGVAYLHSVHPPVVHGDLKGGNILIDAHERPVITDFGLSKVIGDLSATYPELFISSSFAGTTRWMAPELINGMLEDRIPQVTTCSDVYAFASVCLEIITGSWPYPTRRNDASVTLDIVHGVKPSHGAVLSCREKLRLKSDEAQESFVAFLDRCWDQRPSFRPPMTEVQRFLVGLEGCS